MKKILCIVAIVVFIGTGLNNVFAASGKCTVVKIDGTKMIIECEKRTKGFAEGGKIKIKSDNKKKNKGR